MDAGELAGHFPRLYHMTFRGGWASIERHGLLSTSRLLGLYGIKGLERERIEARHRPACVTLQAPGLADAIIRDQKPMSDLGLRRALQGGMEPAEWYRLLNSMVFFWPTKKRLFSLLKARSYRDLEHDVIVVNTAALLKRHEEKVRLSPINSGCTKPFAQARGPDTFKAPVAYPFRERRKKYGLEGAVAELCVTDEVLDITSMVERVVTAGALEVDGIP